ncbi:LysR family transcriptional regulator [Antarctobacter sp.]|uniref:LysR family transcriptional regulator n=1 Tax=Antarctobacter sp. TaxID=1872577 RepID=UPI003A92EA7A
MDTRFLESFIMVAECGSMAEAARRLNVTSAALAQRLRTLEADLGHALVLRAGRTVQPTEEGLAILDSARALVQNTRDLRAIAAKGVPEGQLRLGATATSMTGILPGLITALSHQHPRIEYHVRPGSSVDLYHALIAGDLDVALLVKPTFALPKSVGWVSLRVEPLVLLSPEGADCSDLHRLFSEHRFIRYDRNQWGGQIVDRYLRQQALPVVQFLELDALDAIAAMVDQGLGIAIVPDWGRPWPEGLRVQKTPLPAGDVRETGMVWRKSGARLAAVMALIEVCEQAGP